MRVWGLSRQTCQHCKWGGTRVWTLILWLGVPCFSNLCFQGTADAIQNFSVIQKAPAFSCNVNFGPVDRFTLPNLFWWGRRYAYLHRQSLKAVGDTPGRLWVAGGISMELRNSQVSYIDNLENWLTCYWVCVSKQNVTCFCVINNTKSDQLR